jgi:HAD superfamily hydrolase (TIGR01509 family)
MKMNSDFKAVIFDLDGLVLDTETISFLGWKKAMADFGYCLNDSTYHKIIGLNIPDMQQVFYDAFGADFPLEKICRNRLSYIYDHIDSHGIKIKPGLCEILDFLDKAEILKAVATSSSAESAKRKLTVTALLDRFDYLVCGDQIQNGKPAPDIFLDAAEHLKVQPQDCLVFEDSENGVRAANAAGMTVIMVPDVKRPAPEVAALACKVFTSLKESLPFVRDLLSLEK